MKTKSYYVEGCALPKVGETSSYNGRKATVVNVLLLPLPQEEQHPHQGEAFLLEVEYSLD